MDGETFEYVAVKMPAGRQTRDFDRSVTEQLNQVAQHGWRLSAATEYILIFERPKQS